MKKGNCMRYLVFGFFVLLSFNGMADICDDCKRVKIQDKNILHTEQAVTSNHISSKPKLNLTASQNSIVCKNMTKDYDAVELRLKSYTKMELSKAIPLVRCKLEIDNNREWHLLGKAMSDPPNTRAFTEAAKMIRENKKRGNHDLVKFMFSHKDYLGRDVYDFLEVLKVKHPKQEKYYQRFDKLFKKYDTYNVGQ